MKPRITPVLYCLIAVLVLFLSSCLDSSTEPETPPPSSNNIAAANALAREGMNLLNQSIIDLSDTEIEVNDSEDLMLQATFNNIKSKFTGALALDANNPMANLGLAILGVMEVNYDAELWTMLEDAGAFEGGDKRIINNQFQFLANSPLALMKQIKNTKANSMSIMRVQNFIRNNILPRIDTVITRLDNAVAMADSTVLMIEVDNEEIVEIDCGEIYAFRAASNVVKAGFNMMVAYDMDMTDTSGSGYTWIDEMNEIEVQPVNTYDPYHYSVDGNTLTLDYYEHNYQNDKERNLQLEYQMKILKHNLDNSPTFAKLTSNGIANLNAAKAAILSAAADVKLGVDYILDEIDLQDNDVIKIENIISLNNDIPPTDEDVPAFMQQWQDVNDIADWLTNEVMAGSYSLTVNDIDFNINISAFFNGGISDIEAVLPYLHWNNVNLEWVVDDINDEWSYPVFGNEYSFWYEGSYITIPNINYVIMRRHDVDLDWGYDTDASGYPLSDGEFLYFPDYTFGGIFPGMTRQKLIDLFG
ncbi:MAG: hypothetical protein CVU50_03725 [Candidatus Cloacimonetes bacterium HGW-Cloacimonetes-3]|jgi:hypothetical protein|nr:MAG: hypothetical protein CVU50_03725 [Candidatus Cloacimonetes bacterium HGW-Cloacimonetes-3]